MMAASVLLQGLLNYLPLQMVRLAIGAVDKIKR